MALTRTSEELLPFIATRQYKQFKEQYEEFTRRMLPETETRLANITEFLRNCKKQAEAYQNIQMRK